MSHQAKLNLDEVIHQSRQTFWMLLVVFVVFTALALFVSIAGTATAWGINMFRLVPIFIAVCAGVAGGGLIKTRERESAFKVLAADELRMQSLGSAYRVAFFAALIAQPVLAALASVLPVAHPIGFMAAGTIGLTMVCFLSTFLWLDR